MAWPSCLSERSNVHREWELPTAARMHSGASLSTAANNSRRAARRDRTGTKQSRAAVPGTRPSS
jgi:hypothetical protein